MKKGQAPKMIITDSSLPLRYGVFGGGNTVVRDINLILPYNCFRIYKVFIKFMIFIHKNN